MHSQIIRTEEEIKALIEAMRKDLDDPRIVYGRLETKGFIDELVAALRGEEVDPWDTDAGYWLTSEKGTLGKDYGIG